MAAGASSRGAPGLGSTTASALSLAGSAAGVLALPALVAGADLRSLVAFGSSAASVRSSTVSMPGYARFACTWSMGEGGVYCDGLLLDIEGMKRYFEHESIIIMMSIWSCCCAAAHVYLLWM